jgi:hypothetical protein
MHDSSKMVLAQHFSTSVFLMGAGERRNTVVHLPKKSVIKHDLTGTLMFFDWSILMICPGKYDLTGTLIILIDQS